MPIESKLLEQEWSVIQQSIEERGFRKYPGPLISLENVAPWPADLPFSDFLDFAQECGRQIIYADAHEFRSEDALELLIIVTSLDLPMYDLDTPLQWLEMTDLDSTDEGQDYLRGAGVHYGKLFRLSVHWTFDGVVHSYRRRASWHEKLELKAGRLVEIAEADY